MPRINIKDIIIKQEYHRLVPRMKPDDDKAFEESIKENGIQEPLTLNQDQILLDGHSRYDKAKKFGYQQLPYKIKQFTDKLLEKKYVIECNLARRHLTNFQKVELGIPLLEIEKKLAEQRQKQEGAKYGRGKKKTLGSNDPKEKGKSTEIVAKKVGVSSTTMMRGKHIIEHCTPEQKKKLEDGKTSINTIYNEITRKERNLPKVELPTGQWSVCLVDLPIQFDNKGVRGSSTNNYDTIPIPEIKLGNFNGQNIRDLFSTDCIIFAWFQASTIFDAKDILGAWGFRCVTNIIWDKKRISTGSWLKNRHEHLVIAVKGTMPIPSERIESIQEVEPENRKHSSKPTEFYNIVEKLYPSRKYLDLFSRYKHNENWTCFGNEIEGDKK